IVCGKLDCFRAEVAQKGLYLPEARPVPLIDDLVVVRHGEDISKGIARERADQLVLRVVRILKLVKEPVGMRAAISLGCPASALMGPNWTPRKTSPNRVSSDSLPW